MKDSTYTLLDLDEFIRDCYLEYSLKGIVVGDPHYEWEEVHHPIPKCLDGTETVELLKKDHAVHGVIQSEVYQYPCIFNWEVDYLKGEKLELFYKWQSERSRIGGSVGGKIGGKTTGEKIRREGFGIFNPEYRHSSEFISDCSKGGKKIVENSLGMFDPDYVQSQKRFEDNSKGGKKGSKNTNDQKWMCAETGYISTSGPLTLYQKKRCIDTSKRVLLTPEEVAFIFLWG